MMTTILQDLALVASLLATAVVVLGACAVWWFAARHRTPPRHRPPVTVLKPLCGDEPMLEAALATICNQAYPGVQIVFGVQSADDPALRVVTSIRQRFPACDITVVVDGHIHGPNRKISNLMNMLPAARHDLLVLSDSDLHVPSDYIDQIVAALERPGVGLVTTLCTGLPTTPGIVSRLGATAITHSFLPGALMSRALGREDCLGTTMAVKRDTLARSGGLNALVRHVADDHVLAERIRRIGLGTALAAVVPGTAVPERSLGALHQHELRWARTIRAVEPALFINSSLQFPLFWSAATIVLSGAATWSFSLFALAWAVRTLAAVSVDCALRLAPGRQAVPILLLPLRDLVSVWQVLASYLGDRVVWRGHVMQVDEPQWARSMTLPERVEASGLALAPGDREAAAGSRRVPGR